MQTALKVDLTAGANPTHAINETIRGTGSPVLPHRPRARHTTLRYQPLMLGPTLSPPLNQLPKQNTKGCATIPSGTKLTHRSAQPFKLAPAEMEKSVEFCGLHLLCTEIYSERYSDGSEGQRRFVTRAVLSHDEFRDVDESADVSELSSCPAVQSEHAAVQSYGQQPGNTEETSDAEHTYFQPCIDLAVLRLQRKFNRQYPCVFNTYQVRREQRRVHWVSG